MRPTAVLFATLALLWALVAQLNHVLAPSHIYVWVGGLFVTFSALVPRLRYGLIATLLAGLVCDATAPIAFGTHALLFAAAHAVLFNLRDRVPREETIARTVIALLANLALFLVFSFLQIGDLPEPAAAWPRLIFDLVCSQVLIAVIAPWFFALQERALALAAAAAPLEDHRFN